MNINRVRRRAGVKLRSTSKVAMLALAGIGLIASACGSSSSSSSSNTTAASGGSSSGSSSATTAAPTTTASPFKGKTITIIAPDNAGGGFDKYARLIAPALAAQLGATVNVENIPGGGTVTGTDKMVASKPDGLTLGMVNIPGDIGDVLEHNTALKANLNTLSWIGLAAPETLVMLASEKSPISTFAQLKAAKSVVYGGSKSGISWVGGATILRAFKVPTKFLTGYSSEVKTSQGIVANEFDIAFGDIAGAFYSDIVGHKAKLLLVSGDSSVPSVQKVISGVPQAPAIEAQLSGTAKAAVTEAFALGNIGFALAGPPGMSASLVSTLRSAFTAAMSTSAVKASALKQSLELAPMDGATLAKKLSAAESAAKILSPYIQ